MNDILQGLLNGRKADFESVNLGSIPSAVASEYIMNSTGTQRVLFTPEEITLSYSGYPKGIFEKYQKEYDTVFKQTYENQGNEVI